MKTFKNETRYFVPFNSDPVVILWVYHSESLCVVYCKEGEEIRKKDDKNFSIKAFLKALRCKRVREVLPQEAALIV